MPFDANNLDARIAELDAEKRKLEKLRELLADKEIREVISDPAIMQMLHDSAAANGSNGHGDPVDPAGDDEMPAEGTLRRAVLDAARSLQGKFEGGDILRKLEADKYKFNTEKPKISIHGALLVLMEKGFIRLVRKGSGKQPNIYEVRK